MTETLPDDLRDALGQVIAGLRREWRREHDLQTAHGEALIAKLRAEIVEMRGRFESVVQQQINDTSVAVSARLALVRDGAQGPQGERGEKGDIGFPGIKGDPGPQGPPGKDGANGAQGIQGEKGERGEIGFPGVVGGRGPQGERGESGSAGKDGKDGPQGPQGEKGDIGFPGVVGATGPRGERGERGEQGLQGKEGKSGATGLRGERGEKGDRGEQGPQGKLPFIKAYDAGAVYYAGDVVAADGGTWQARKDTGKAPPHGDWIALALRGIDGLTPHVRGTWREDATYHALDIVAFNKGSFIARQDDPGPCPGDGWQLLTSHGVRGDKGLPGPKGDKGEAGAKGERGADGSVIIKWQIDHANFTAVPLMSDGSTGPTLELRSLFEQFDEQTSRK